MTSFMSSTALKDPEWGYIMSCPLCFHRGYHSEIGMHLMDDHALPEGTKIYFKGNGVLEVHPGGDRT